MGTTDRDKYNYHDHLNLFFLRNKSEKECQKCQGGEGRFFSLVERRQGVTLPLDRAQMSRKRRGFPKGEGSLG